MTSLVKIFRHSSKLTSRQQGFSSVTRQFVLSGDVIKDKGRGEENVRFRKEDERLLRALLQKVKSQADQVDVHEAESSKSLELSALKEILGKYNISDGDYQQVLAWKHS